LPCCDGEYARTAKRPMALYVSSEPCSSRNVRMASGTAGMLRSISASYTSVLLFHRLLRRRLRGRRGRRRPPLPFRAAVVDLDRLCHRVGGAALVGLRRGGGDRPRLLLRVAGAMLFPTSAHQKRESEQRRRFFHLNLASGLCKFPALQCAWP